MRQHILELSQHCVNPFSVGSGPFLDALNFSAVRDIPDPMDAVIISQRTVRRKCGDLLWDIKKVELHKV